MIPFESFSYPFFDFNFKADYRALVSSFLSDTGEGGVGSGRKALYVHIPFCDTICSFCPFVKSVGNDERITAYLAALHRELQVVGATKRVQGWQLDSVYIGGGTPSVLTEDQLAALFAVIKENFTLADDAEISFEFEAKSVTDGKFKTLAELGTTRVSFGVQTFDEATRKMINITASLDQVKESIGLATKYFSNTNLDMMFGFPGQSLEEALKDAELAATSGIGSVSVYPVDYVMTLPAWQDRIRRGELPKPAPLAERSDMFHAARTELKRHMHEQNMYCFGSADAPPTRYMFSTLYGGYADECIGVGSGAYSFIRGLAYYNEANERTYVKQAQTGVQPVAFASPGHAYEKGLVFFPKRMEFNLDSLDELSLSSTYGEKIDRIVDDGLARRDGNILRLTPSGERVYSELMVHFFSDAQRRLYDRMCTRLRQDVGVIDEGEWDAGERRVRRMGAWNAMSDAASQRQARAVAL
ncbi:coproporphyrinogen-III oxidase family protein [Streptomyces mirabilis]|uniref:coproporphyrinogen-III oxidase family protein n=1 Tax=Streptomyces mirabilis TaxID=68239 RepID=UPI003688D7AB